MGTDADRLRRRQLRSRFAAVLILGVLGSSACSSEPGATATTGASAFTTSQPVTTPTEPVPTTVTTPPATTEAFPSTTSEPGGFVAHIGCSQTKLNIRGYQRLGGTRLEPYETGGGQISLWSRPTGDYWKSFDQAVQGKSITAAWVEICMTNSGARTTSYEEVVAAVEVLRERVPVGVPIFASGLEIFEPPDLCGIAGPSASDLTRSYADRLVEDGLAAPGPVLGPLDASTTTDGCHPNGAGAEITGSQLLDFFG